jgi:hypothetical protein
VATIKPLLWATSCPRIHQSRRRIDSSAPLPTASPTGAVRIDLTMLFRRRRNSSAVEVTEGEAVIVVMELALLPHGRQSQRLRRHQTLTRQCPRVRGLPLQLRSRGCPATRPARTEIEVMGDGGAVGAAVGAAVEGSGNQLSWRPKGSLSYLADLSISYGRMECVRVYCSMVAGQPGWQHCST